MTDNLAVPLATARFQSWRRALGVPARITVGAPKFWQGPELEFARPLAPWAIFGKGLSPDEGHRRYVARLETHADKADASLANIARRHDGERLVLLCFEAPGLACHRVWFATWWQERHGVDVPGIDADQPQPRLF